MMLKFRIVFIMLSAMAVCVLPALWYLSIDWAGCNTVFFIEQNALLAWIFLESWL